MSNLHVDPTAVSYEEWAALYAQALWLEQWRMKNKETMLANLFSDKSEKRH